MTNLQKAKIINLNTGETIPCQFNPEEYTHSKQNSWQESGGKGNPVPELEFKGGAPDTLRMKLFFDTTELGQDVRLLTNRLINLMHIVDLDSTTKTGTAPRCRFIWGKIPSFTAVITRITQKFTMFLADGTPVRANLDVSFKEARDDTKFPLQNPTTHSEPRKTRRVNLGDRIDMIAFEEYGDPTRWYDLALLNELDDPLNLEPGQILKIPQLS